MIELTNFEKDVVVGGGNCECARGQKWFNQRSLCRNWCCDYDSGGGWSWDGDVYSCNEKGG